MKSEVTVLGQVTFPAYTGLRIMMMPFLLEDVPRTLGPYTQYVALVERLRGMSLVKVGTAYLTIDEADVSAGETHRRPGLHIDGMSWGGGGNPYAANGMLLVSTVVGCKAYRGTFIGTPTEDGDCESMRDQCGSAIVMQPNTVYWCSPTTVHESIPHESPTRRQFVRLSMPNNADYHGGYTPSPVGIAPTGKLIGPRKAEYMGHRP